MQVKDVNPVGNVNSISYSAGQSLTNPAADFTAVCKQMDLSSYCVRFGGVWGGLMDLSS